MPSSRTALACALLCAPATAGYAQERASTPRIAFLDVLSIQPEGRIEVGDSGSTGQIGAVVIRGNEAIADERFQAVVEEFFGEPLTDEVLDQLTDELAQLAREEGFPYARMDIDDDAARLGIVEVQVDEGRIDHIAIEGYDNAQARKMLEGLTGRPAQRTELESMLLRISDIPAVILKGAKLRRDGDISVLVVTLEKRAPQARIAADNYGTETFGPIRVNGSSRFTGVLTSSDEIRTSVRVNPFELDELLFVSGSYQTQITDGGATLQLVGSIGETEPGGTLGGLDISGDSVRASATLSAPLMRSKDASVWLEGGAAYISIEQDDLGELLRDDTVVTASVGLRTRFALAGGGFLRMGARVERGLDIFGATRVGDLNASRSDGDGVFTKFSLTADARIPIAERVDVYLALAEQLADRPLLASEELALGGAYRVRGYEFAEVLGDEGFYGLAELRYRVNTDEMPLDFLQLYGFVDGGYVADIDETFGEGSLFSAGPGMRGRLGPLDFEVESAFPLGGTGERRETSGPEINVRAGVTF